MALDQEEEDADADTTAFVVVQTMFKEDDQEYVAPKSDVVAEKAEIERHQQVYLSGEIEGNLVFRIPNSRSLTSYSGSKMSKIVPKCKILCDGDPISSRASEGTDPDWLFSGKLSVKCFRRDNLEVKISVESEGNFLGQFVIPLAHFLKSPENWLLNGYYDLVERKEKLGKGEKTSTLGLIYIQMKWSPAGYPDAKSFPPYITDFEKNKGQVLPS